MLDSHKSTSDLSTPIQSTCPPSRIQDVNDVPDGELLWRVSNRQQRDFCARLMPAPNLATLGLFSRVPGFPTTSIWGA